MSNNENTKCDHESIVQQLLQLQAEVTVIPQVRAEITKVCLVDTWVL